MGEKVEKLQITGWWCFLEDITHSGTCTALKTYLNSEEEIVELPSLAEIKNDKALFAKAYNLQSKEQDPFYGKTVVQKGVKKYIIQNPSTFPLEQEEMDAIYDLDYMRDCHPSYKAYGGIAALEEVQFSIVSCRGCFGSCSFCAIHAHQGRIIQARSHESILREAKIISQLPGFKGYIHDVGGPTANFRHPSVQTIEGRCVARIDNVCSPILVLTLTLTIAIIFPCSVKYVLSLVLKKFSSAVVFDLTTS